MEIHIMVLSNFYKKLYLDSSNCKNTVHCLQTEYIVVIQAKKDTLWMKQSLKELNQTQKEFIIFYNN